MVTDAKGQTISKKDGLLSKTGMLMPAAEFVGLLDTEARLSRWLIIDETAYNWIGARMTRSERAAFYESVYHEDETWEIEKPEEDE